MSKLEGVAKKFDGTAIDYVSIFNWSDGKCIAQVKPDASGSWEYEYFDNLNVGIAYVADGCEPITHGPYSLDAPWSPHALFTGGKLGFWYDPSDLTTLFKDIQMSQPVANNGDRVAVMLDKSGNNRHLVQSDINRMPVYKTDGVQQWVETDGSSDMLVSDSSFDLSVNSISIVTAFQLLASDRYGQLSIVGRPNQGINITPQDMQVRPLINTAGSTVSFMVPESFEPRLTTVTLDKSTRNFSGFVNGVKQGDLTVPTNTWFDDPSYTVIGANRLADYNPFYSNSKFYGAIMTQNLMSDADRVLAEQYLAEKSGVILT